MPGSEQGIKDNQPTIAELLKPLGYTSGQFGKNHLGDRDEHLPTNHGFDEFYGNLYHLNAEEEPETYYYPKDEEFHKKYGPRGVIHSYSDGKIEDTGPLTKKRMETVDDEVTVAALDFMDRAVKADKPFFIWWNSTRMHVWTHLKPESKGKTGYGVYADGMVEHDGHVGQLLDHLDKLGVADNTIVMYSTDNGAEVFTWPDGGTTMYANEKGTTWEGGFRVPTLIRWPGVIEPGTIINDLAAHEDMLPTLLAAAGDDNVKEDLLKGKKVGNMNYKVHLDGYNLLPFLKGEEEVTPRREFLYWTDDGNVAALRYNDWKIHFMIQESHGVRVWQDPFTTVRMPMLMNLRSDPFERAWHESIGYDKWALERVFMIAPAGAIVGEWLQSFKDFPPRQKPGSFNLSNVMDAITKGAGGK
jgi:arylsulfatase